MTLTQTLTALLSLVAIASSANAKNLPTYKCDRIGEEGANVGRIVISGDPVKNIYKNVVVNGVAQKIRPGTTDPAYIYLYDLRTGAKTYALEVVNYPQSYDQFEVSVYGSDHVVLGSTRIARYGCERVPNMY